MRGPVVGLSMGRIAGAVAALAATVVFLTSACSSSKTAESSVSDGGSVDGPGTSADGAVPSDGPLATDGGARNDGNAADAGCPPNQVLACSCEAGVGARRCLADGSQWEPREFLERMHR